MPEIGATLREARMRARIDLSEVEAETKIRGRYLRALENEEWDLLPGPTFVKSFLRTYATALGLDGKALVEEYRLNHEHSGDGEMQAIASRRRRGGDPGDPGRAPGGLSRGYVITFGLVGIVIVFLVIGLITRGSSKPAPASHTRTTAAKHHSQRGSTHRRSASGHARHARRNGAHAAVPAKGGGSAQASVSLRATSTVWVCLMGEGVTGQAASEGEAGAEGAEKLVSGIDLQAGETRGPYHAKRFTMTLGNNAVSMKVDGSPIEVPESTQAIGYEITSSGASPLPAEHQPTCG